MIPRAFEHVAATGLRAASEALPMRDAFAVLFFVSVGMLLDPRHLIEAAGLIAATLAVVLVGKPLVARTHGAFRRIAHDRGDRVTSEPWPL